MLKYGSQQEQPQKFRERECSTCGGNGELTGVSRIFFVTMARFFYKKFRPAMTAYRQWKISGIMVCPDCQGRGQWEEEY